jgi:hypothetical protein
MVHGLRSTPLAWQQLTNELIGDPEIRERYQFWHYLYPTGFPFLTSAADFRDELEQLRRILDPSSELIVPSNHRTYENHEALAEVIRILKLHLAELKRGEAAANREECCAYP